MGLKRGRKTHTWEVTSQAVGGNVGNQRRSGQLKSKRDKKTPRLAWAESNQTNHHIYLSTIKTDDPTFGACLVSYRQITIVQTYVLVKVQVKLLNDTLNALIDK